MDMGQPLTENTFGYNDQGPLDSDNWRCDSRGTYLSNLLGAPGSDAKYNAIAFAPNTIAGRAASATLILKSDFSPHLPVSGLF